PSSTRRCRRRWRRRTWWRCPRWSTMPATSTACPTCCWRPWPPAAPWWPRAWRASRTWSTTAPTECWCRPATWPRCAPRCSGSPTTRRSAHAWAPPQEPRWWRGTDGTPSRPASRNAMPRRQRWTPVRGTGTRVSDPFERALLAAADLPLRLLGRPPRVDAPPLDADVREVLVLRLDRIGDLLMSLPALGDLRRAFPRARIRLAVGRWSEGIARRAPVDEVMVWSAPWVGRAEESAQSWWALAAAARALRREPLDLAFDLQGDVRASLLMALTGARERVGYANTGGARLLTRVVELDETVSWVEQNRRAVAAAAGPAAAAPSPALLTAADRAAAEALLRAHGLDARRPLVGLHPSGGRRIKQWDLARWREVALRLQREFGAALVLTGTAADRPLAAEVARGLGGTVVDLSGELALSDVLS